MATATLRSSRKSVVPTGVEASSIVFLSGRVMTWRWIFEANPGKRRVGTTLKENSPALGF
jgi:hypothetical protein